MGNMNKLYKILISILCTVMFVSCWNREKVNVAISGEMEEECSIKYLSKDLDMGSYIDSISFIALDDSNENAFLRDINKCIIKEDRIYVLDFFGTESVKVFDMSGKFLFMVGNKGNGPGEFFRAEDFDVSKDGIFLLDVSRKKIFEYALDNSFKGEYYYGNKLSGVNSFLVTDQCDFLLGMNKGYNDSKVLLVDKNFKIVESILPFEKNDTEGQLKIGSFRRCGNKTVFYYPVSDDVYLFDESGRISKKYTISLNETPISNDIRRDYKNIVSERKLGGFSYFHEVPYFNGNIFVTTMFCGPSKALFCLDIVNGKYAIDSYEGIMELFKKLSIHNFNFPIYMDETRVLCSLNQTIYEKIKEQELIPSKYQKVLSEGGTILLVYHLKH